MMRGLDVSSVQGTIDWLGLKALEIGFAVVKCATGNEAGVDASFARNVEGARNANIVVGCYNFGYPLPGSGSRDPKEQAKAHFDACGQLGAETGDLPPVLDLEWPPRNEWTKWAVDGASIRDWALAYLETAEGLWGRAPILYTYPEFWSELDVGSVSEFSRYPLYIADYAQFESSVPTEGSKPKVPAPWSDWTLWQHTGGKMHLPNGAQADFDVLNGDAVALQQLTGLRA